MRRSVKPAVRLDVVVKLREREEDRARRELAEAQRQADQALRALSDVQQRLHAGPRERGSAAEWLLADTAAVRAREDIKRAEVVVRTADQKLGVSRKSYAGVHARVEVMRKVADSRRGEIVAEAEASERKAQDENARLLFLRR
jgi:flagellar export protein FliJ